ncbi:probable proline--tRNA ligase, mitochondrial isoform X1 [Schistocerca piceifrons]|uniref:probable proline--tRNA ligase, mitochondrial isoform X1 n=2 Tax=Schistocerca piceifrons TaxID=274613 RepID=UPI001F5FEEAF|nr:probable proline--tRNA ligase, mitochondrial isoform X1 [Schistocerca piceifrons]
MSFARNKLSKLFRPVNVLPKNVEVQYDGISKSQKLMLDMGFIRAASPGFFHLLPLGERALQKLINIVEKYMQTIGAQKILLPLLTNAQLWKASGRWTTEELLTLQDRHNKTYVLSPTHEEAVTDLIASVPQLSHHHFPLLLYQIGSKFRDEMKPRFGLMRAREFIMKDLYSFDTSVANAEVTYDTVTTAYSNIFKEIGVECMKVQAASGIMGGTLSHEYHFISEAGEDRLYICESCNYVVSEDIFSGDCPECKSKNFKRRSGIEVGHTFLLGTRYSAPLKAVFQTSDGTNGILQMGCFGLGLTRILAAVIESLSSSSEIRLPFSLAPFRTLIIPPKEGSKESFTTYLSEELYDAINSLELFKNDVVIDDRCHLTIGRRLMEGRKSGFPFIIIVGKKAVGTPPCFEVHDVLSNMEISLPLPDLIKFIQERVKGDTISEMQVSVSSSV